MSTTRAERVQDLFAAALDLPPEQWPALLAEACGSDAALRAEVESLLQHHRYDDPDFLRPITPNVHRSTDPDAPDPLIGRRIRQYVISKTLASGGMGTVYLAEQAQPRREVAIKVMRLGLGSRAAQRRFEYESQVLASLKHPGIAQVIESGTHQEEGSRLGLPYFVMEYVEGAQPITAFAGKRQHGNAEAVRTESLSLPGRGEGAGGLSTRERLTLFLQVCDAVQHGHQKGIIHRDLKPANLLVDAAGRVKVIDFGVARATDTDIAATTMRTDVGQLIGTLQYMSPEQCEADVSNIDTRSDVYSLGVVLYEMLTGSLPYDTSGTTVFNATRTIREQAPKRPSSIDVKLRGDVETIVLKALEKERERRYQSMADLAGDVRRYLNHEPIEARRASAVYQLRMLARKHKAAAHAVLGTFATLVAATAISGYFWSAAVYQQSIAEASQRANALGLAEASITLGDAASARELLTADKLDRASWEYRHLASRVDQSVATLHQKDQATTPKARICAVYFDPIRNRAVIAQRLDDSRITRPIVFDTSATGWTPTPARSTDVVIGQSSILSGDGRFLVGVQDTPHGPAALWVYDAASPSQGPIAYLDLPGIRLEATACLPDRSEVVVADDRGDLRLLDLASIPLSASSQQPVRLTPVAENHAHSGGISAIVFSRDGTLLATASEDYTAKIWKLEEFRALGKDTRPQQTLIGHTYKVNSVAFSPDGDRLATGSEDATVRLWDVATGGALPDGVLRAHDGPVRAVAFDETGTRLVSGGVDGTLRVWDVDEHAKQADASGLTSQNVQRRQLVTTLHGHTDQIVWAAFDDEGAVLSASWDGRVLRWRPNLPDVPTLSGHTSSILGADFTADGRYAVSGAGDSGVFIWDVETTMPVARWYAGGRWAIWGLVVRQIGTRDVVFAVSRFESAAHEDWLKLHLLDLDRSGTQPRLNLHHELDLGGGGEGRPSLAVSEDGQRVAVGRSEEVVQIVEIPGDLRPRSWRPLQDELPVDKAASPWGLVFLDDEGHWLATATENAVDGVSQGRHPITIWNVATGERAGQTDADSDHVAGIRALAVRGPIGGLDRLLASGSGDNSVKVWRVREANGSGPPRLKLLHTCMGHTDAVMDVAFHPTESRLASGGLDRIVRVWDLNTGLEVAALRGHVGAVMVLAFDLQGRRIASGSTGKYGTDNVVRLWEVTSSREAEAGGWAANRATARRAQSEVRDIFRNRMPASVEEVQQQVETLERIQKDVKEVALEILLDVIGSPEHLYQPAINILEGRDEAAADPSRLPQRRADALDWADQAVNLAPRDTRCHIIRGAVLLRLGRSQEALDSLETARGLAKRPYTALYALLALAHADREDLIAAKQALDAAKASVTDPRTQIHGLALRWEPLLEEAQRKLAAHAQP